MQRRGTIWPRARSSPSFASKRATTEGREKNEEEERKITQRGPGARAAAPRQKSGWALAVARRWHPRPSDCLVGWAPSTGLTELGRAVQ